MPIKAKPVMLESGDRLTRAEFHRRYCLRPDIKRAELVGGVVYVPSPTRFSVHDRQHGDVVLWLGTYAMRHPDLRSGVDATVMLDANNEVQPDGFVFRVPPPDERAARVNDEGYIEGAPQLVLEVAASSASYDLHDKLRAYEQAGVQEYVVWRTLDEQVEWFRLGEGAYERVTPDERGVIESHAFPGLRLHVAKLLSGDMAGVLAELDESASR